MSDNGYADRAPAMVSDVLASEARLTALLVKLQTGVAIPSVPVAGPVTAPVTGPVVDSPTAPATTPVVSVADAMKAKYFPADFGEAAFPSPENSRITRLGDAIGGKPYLLDSSGTMHRLVSPTPDRQNGYEVNGNRTVGGGSEEVYSLLTVRQGKVYAQRSTGQWQQYNASMGSMYSASLPDAFLIDASGATTSTVAPSTVTTPAAPTPSPTPPGSSGKVLEVGPGLAYPMITDAIKVAAAGDTVHIAAALYVEAPPAITVPLYIWADKGAVLDATGQNNLARGKGALVPSADCIIEGLEIKGAGMQEANAGGTAAIRPDLGCNYLIVRDCHLHDNQNGIACGDVPVSITVDGGLFENNGLLPGNDGHGYTHNVYVSHGTRRFEATNGWVSRDANGGHPCKSRAYETVLDNVVLSGGMEAALLDVPNGSTICTITNSILSKAAGAFNHSIADYGTDDTSSGNSGMQFINTKIEALCDNAFMLINGGSVVSVDAATKAKTTGKIDANGGKITGF